MRAFIQMHGYSYSLFTTKETECCFLYDEAWENSMFDKTGYFRVPDYIGMENTYDKLAYNDQMCR